MSYFTSTRRLIERWQHRGLIDRQTADKLLADIKSDRSGFNLGTVLATLGGVLLGSAVILLVAANWEYMPRLLRVGLIFTLIWASYLIGAWRETRGDNIWSTALYILGAASFGAGIALISQMYHISGDESQAIAIWSLGVFISAFLLRSSVLSATAMLLAAYYLQMIVFDGDEGLFGFSYIVIGPAIALLGIASARFTRSPVTAHMVVIFSILWFCLCYAADGEEAYLKILAIIGAFGLVANKLMPQLLRKLTQIPEAFATYGLFALLISLSVFQIEPSLYFSSNEHRIILYGIAILLVAVLALLMHGRENRGLRWLVYFAFSLEVLFLAFITIGTIISTSGFFLIVGILILLLAVLVRRFEKRMKYKINAGAENE